MSIPDIGVILSRRGQWETVQVYNRVFQKKNTFLKNRDEGHFWTLDTGPDSICNSYTKIVLMQFS